MTLGDRCKFYHPVKDVFDDVTKSFKNVELSDNANNAQLPDGADAPSEASAANVQPADGASAGAGDGVKPKPHYYQPRRTPIYNRSGGPQFQFRLDDLKAEELENLRQREITQLKRRFPQATAFEDEKGREAFTVTFVPSDPDWVSAQCLMLFIWLTRH